MKRRKTYVVLTAIMLLLICYVVFASRVFYLKPELDFSEDVPRDAHPIIEEWYAKSGHKKPPSFQANEIWPMLSKPYYDRLQVPVHYRTITPDGMLISVELLWEPWVKIVYFSTDGEDWHFDHEESYR